MSPKVEVIDREGWRRVFPLEKTIVHVGSDPRNDIVLEAQRGGGVAPLHAQLIISTGRSGCQLVNLGNADILLGLSGDRTLPPRAAANVVNGTLLKLGDFTLIFRGDDDEGYAARDFTGRSQNIGLNLSLPRTQLEPNRRLDGVVTVTNLGDFATAQIELKVDGLDPDCYEIEPGPVLPSGGEKELSLHLYHRGNKPLAGDCYVTIHAAAPTAYPGEQATVSQVIRVRPHYHHTLCLLPPAKAEQAPEVDERPVPAAPRAERAGGGQGDWWAPPPPGAEERAPRAEVAAPVRGEERPALPVRAAPPPRAAAQAPPVTGAVSSPPVAEAAPPAAEAPPAPPEVVSPPPVVEVVPPPPVAEAPPAPPEVVSPPPAVETVSPPPVAEAAPPPPEVEPVPPAVETVSPPPVAEAAPAPPVAEPAPPAVEAVSPVEAEGEPAVEAGPPPETKAEPPPATEPVSSAEDWWAPAGSERRVLKLSVSPPPETEPTPVEPGPPPPAEAWWSAEAEEAGLEELTEERPVLKLKANLPPEAEEVQAEVEPGPSPPAEDWWSAEGEAGPVKRRALSRRRPRMGR